MSVRVLLVRFQSQLPGARRYTRVMPTLATIVREEGWSAAYRGFVPKALRLGIGQSVGLVMFEQLLLSWGVNERPHDHEVVDVMVSE